jgi:hypothetical protein
VIKDYDILVLRGFPITHCVQCGKIELLIGIDQGTFGIEALLLMAVD